MSEIGHNLPSLRDLLLAETIDALIAAEIEPLDVRAAILVDSCARFVAAFPEIKTGDDDAKAAEVLAVCNRFVGNNGRVDKAREEFKRPILDASNAIGSATRGPFAAVADKVRQAMKPIADASIAFKRRQEAASRQIWDPEATRSADLTRSKGDNVGTTSLRYKRVVTVTNADLVPRHLCAPDLTRIRVAAGKAGEPIPDIAGVEIHDEPDLTVRR